MRISPTLAAIARIPPITELRRRHVEKLLTGTAAENRHKRLANKHWRPRPTGVGKMALRAAEAEERRLQHEAKIARLLAKHRAPAAPIQSEAS